MLLHKVALTLGLLWPLTAGAQQPEASRSRPNTVTVHRDKAGFKLQVDGHDFMIIGMNWGYMPIGENYSYSFWDKPDPFIRAALDREMSLLTRMGINAIRQYDGIPPRWVTYIYEKYGIYTAINHTVGRYGFTIDGAWIPAVNYQDPRVRQVLTEAVIEVVERYQDVPGVLMWILGNENNYGLHWSSPEIEALPEGERDAARAQHLYSLYGEIITATKKRDSRHPVSIANGDLQYIDLIAKHCPNLDIMGTNVYRGISARDLFDEVAKKLNLPVYFSEFGADAYDARRRREDDIAQARYLKGQWQEIYEQSHDKGVVGNAIGGFTFQWSDGWWKYGHDHNLDVHDNHASWPNGGYPHDFVEGHNNMNEEWFGICAKGKPDSEGLYQVYPRTAYYVLQQAFRLDPYGAGTSRATIGEHFARIDAFDYSGRYTSNRAEERLSALEAVRVSQARIELQTISSGGTAEKVSTAANSGAGSSGKTNTDHMESFYVDFHLQPTGRLDANVSFNVLGHVADNKLDEIFYENRGRAVAVRRADGGALALEGIERLKVYQASFDWDANYFDLEGFYRTGHYHWGYEGDFFGLYREANYQRDVDIYNATAPYGVVFSGKQMFEGVKVALGPQLYWGANPSVIAKVAHQLGGLEFALIHQEDLARQSAVAASSAIPEPATRRSTLYLAYQSGPITTEAGAILAGSNKIGQRYLSAKKTSGATYLGSGYQVMQKSIGAKDTLGGKLRVKLSWSAIHWYLQGSYKGLVADGGPDGTTTFTGFSLKEDGRGNQYSLLSGVVFNLGLLQIAPNVLYQKPLERPLPAVDDHFEGTTGRYYPAVRPRNVWDDPFAVLGNRETLGLELLLLFDPTPGTWFWMWDNDVREDAVFAGSLDFVYRMQPTSRDSLIGFTENGDSFPFGGAPPARDVWDVRARLVYHPQHDLRVVAHLYGGQGQARGTDPRVVNRGGLDTRITWDTMALSAYFKVNDWGPYDYHRDFNLTFPIQVWMDLSMGLSLPKLTLPYTRIGLRGQLRYLDQHSPRYPYEGKRKRWANEYELGTYVSLSL